LLQMLKWKTSGRNRFNKNDTIYNCWSWVIMHGVHLYYSIFSGCWKFPYY
jgi:hypothetical protein